jgi:hypothetical protein
MTNSEAVAAVDYRRMAERCREMARRTTRPGPLLSRAEAFEADTTAIEKERRASSSEGQTVARRAQRWAGTSRQHRRPSV